MLLPGFCGLFPADTVSPFCSSAVAGKSPIFAIARIRITDRGLEFRARRPEVGFQLANYTFLMTWRLKPYQCIVSLIELWQTKC